MLINAPDIYATIARHTWPRKDAVVPYPYQDAVHKHMLYNIFSDRFSTHYLFSPIGPSTARLRLIKDKPCLVCDRHHHNDNAMLSCDGRVLFKCFREPRVLLDMSDENDETRRGALFRYPGMCRWAIFLADTSPKSLAEISPDQEYAVYGYNATGLILYRFPDMLCVKDTSLVCAVRTMVRQRHTVIQEVHAVQWHVALDHGALLTLKHSIHRGTTLMAINVQPIQATPSKSSPKKPRRASALCKSGLVYTALQYYINTSPPRLYVMLEDDTKKHTWVQACKDSALYKAFQGPQPVVYRFMA